MRRSEFLIAGCILMLAGIGLCIVGYRIPPSVRNPVEDLAREALGMQKQSQHSRAEAYVHLVGGVTAFFVGIGLILTSHRNKHSTSGTRTTLLQIATLFAFTGILLSGVMMTAGAKRFDMWHWAPTGKQVTAKTARPLFGESETQYGWRYILVPRIIHGTSLLVFLGVLFLKQNQNNANTSKENKA